MINIKRNTLTPTYFNHLTNSVGWITRPTEQLNIAIKNSIYNVCIFDNSKVIAMGRMIGDGSMSFFIKDVVVSPEYQGKGIGKLLINDMISYIKETTPKGFKVCVELMSSPSKESFYKQFNFETRISIDNGSGMTLFIMNN